MLGGAEEIDYKQLALSGELESLTIPKLKEYCAANELKAVAYSRPLFSSTWAIFVTPPRVPLSNRLEDNHAPNVSHRMCLR